jgi:hypothetical protein
MRRREDTEEHFLKLVQITGISTALQEILYGFIMSLIFIYATRFGILSYSSSLEFIVVVVGMNFSWGAIDGIVYYYLSSCNQRIYHRVISGKSDLSHDKEIEFLLDELSGSPAGVLKEDDLRDICERITTMETKSEEQLHSDKKEIAKTSLGMFIFTAITLIPVVIPILVMPDFMEALAMASYISSFVLFLVGYYLGPYLGVNKWVSGFMLFLLSISISIIATFTGG